MSITFQVSRVERARAPLVIPTQDHGLCLQQRAVEAMGASGPFLPSDGHALVHAVGIAYADHYPLVLSPDVIWLAIAQGFAMHVTANAERLRERFVRHKGKVTIGVRRDDFVQGAPHNP